APYAAMNEAQLEAVLAPAAPMLILAGAGSGKTTVLVNRIAYLLRFGPIYQDETLPEGLDELMVELLEEYAREPAPEMEQQILSIIGARPVFPWRVMAVTFTNKAARELSERLIHQVGAGAGEVLSGTFHAICARILRRDIERLGYPRDFTIYDTDDCKRVMKECVRGLNMDEKKFPPGSMLTIISRAKDSLMDPDQFEAENKSDFRMGKVAKLYREYQTRLEAAGALDFDDMIRLTVRLLRQEPELLEYYRRRFAFVFVDEYQDTNHAQFVLTELLAGGGSLMVVGDDDQSIYKFRGATIENILSFENRHPDASVVRLEQNYRSTSAILDCANSTISNNVGRKGKTLWTKNGRGDPARLYQAGDSFEEARFVAQTILETCAGEGRDYSDFAVLYRTNAQSAALEDALLKSGVPYRLYGGMKFYERKEVKDVVAYLTILANPRDDLRLARIINEPKRGIGDTSIAKMQELAAEGGVPLWEVITRADEFPELARQRERLRLFVELIESLKKQGETLLPSELLTRVVEETGYLAAIRELDKTDGRDRCANIDTLADNIKNYEDGTDSPTLSGFLEGAALATDLDTYEEGAGTVSLMTMHSAKGLEFPIVFLPGMEEELFPSGRSIFEPGELEEERRLCYVAITRAKER
ncbi:MAG: UvrD-helicase domain-containing protein, partial [Clostridia bacterium]|nr:UvrD-helicase domain-containing protein [Clostridia bacterium]